MATAHDLLFTLRIPSMRTDRESTITIQAFDGQHVDSTGHNRIDVRVLFRARPAISAVDQRIRTIEIFPRGVTYCATASHCSIDGDDAKELVCSLFTMTDEEFCEGYTPEQRAFVEEYAEEIQQYAERWKCDGCGAVTGRSSNRWVGKRCRSCGRRSLGE